LRLRDNLDGLDWLVAQLGGRPASAKPVPRVPLLPQRLTPGGAQPRAK